jgi:hypothetical protein
LARPRARGRTVADDSPPSSAPGQAGKRDCLVAKKIKGINSAEDCREIRPTLFTIYDSGLTLLVLQFLVERAKLCELLIGRNRGMRVLLRSQLVRQGIAAKCATKALTTVLRER